MMWRAFFLLYSIVAKYQDSHEETVEVMRQKINALIRRHNDAISLAEEEGITYYDALNLNDPYMTSLEIDIISGFPAGHYIELVPEGDISFDRAFV